MVIIDVRNNIKYCKMCDGQAAHQYLMSIAVCFMLASCGSMKGRE